MTTLPAPQCAQVTHRWTLNGRDGSNRFQVRYSGAWDPADALALVSGSGNFEDMWDGTLLPDLATSFHSVEWEVVDLADPLHAAVIHPHPTTGGQALLALPNNVTMDVYWPVASRVRGGRSHSFLTGFVPGELTSPLQWNAGVLTDALAWSTTLRNNINARTFGTMGSTTLGVVHYHRAHVALAPPQFEAFLPPFVEPLVHSRSRRIAR